MILHFLAFTDGRNTYVRLKTDERLTPAQLDDITRVVRDNEAAQQVSADGCGVMILPNDPELTADQLKAQLVQPIIASIGPVVRVMEGDI
jgi:hypothetical protein